MLTEYLASPAVWPDAGTHRTRGPGVSLEVFDRRTPIYRATIQFIQIVLKGHRIELQPIFQFASDTDEALFLFDDHMAEYLAELYRRAVQLRAVLIMLEGPPDQRTPQLIREEVEYMRWFLKQFEEARGRFAPYLRLGETLANKDLQPTAAGARKSRRG